MHGDKVRATLFVRISPHFSSCHHSSPRLTSPLTSRRLPQVRGTTDRVVGALLRHGFKIMRNTSSMNSEYRSGTFGRLLARGSTIYAVNPRFRKC